jgi:hypothetical protein
MKIAFLTIMFLFSTTAHAEVHALFPTDDATLIIQGNDADATALFDSMNVATLDDGRTLSKHVSYDTMFAKSVFDLTCKQARSTAGTSCTLKFFSPEAVVNKVQKSILMGINDRLDARSVASMFNEKTSTPYQAEVFLSMDGKLRIWKTFNSSGDVASFTMTYN